MGCDYQVVNKLLNLYTEVVGLHFSRESLNQSSEAHLIYKEV